MNYIRSLSVALLGFITVMSIAAQSEGRTFPRLKHVPAISLSEDVKRSGLTGAVRVYVKVDSDGSVDDVRDAEGPGDVCSNVTRPDVLLVRNAAVEAAKGATFEPRRKNELDFAWLRFELPEQNGLVPDEKLERFVLSPATPGLRDKILELPKPPYPPAARAVRATGTVSVELLVDETGNVFSSRALSGHPLLRASASRAACSARFRPEVSSGIPTKVLWIVTYNFVP